MPIDTERQHDVHARLKRHRSRVETLLAGPSGSVSAQRGRPPASDLHALELILDKCVTGLPWSRFRGPVSARTAQRRLAKWSADGRLSDIANVLGLGDVVRKYLASLGYALADGELNTADELQWFLDTVSNG